MCSGKTDDNFNNFLPMTRFLLSALLFGLVETGFVGGGDFVGWALRIGIEVAEEAAVTAKGNFSSLLSSESESEL